MNRRVTLGEVLFSGIGSFLGAGALYAFGAPEKLVVGVAVAIWTIYLFILSEEPRS